jgi:hypothetical protein
MAEREHGFLDTGISIKGLDVENDDFLPEALFEEAPAVNDFAVAVPVALTTATATNYMTQKLQSYDCSFEIVRAFDSTLDDMPVVIVEFLHDGTLQGATVWFEPLCNGLYGEW